MQDLASEQDGEIGSAKLDSGLVLADGDHVGDDNEFDADFLAFRRTLLKTIKNFLDTGEVGSASSMIIELKDRLRDVERDGACHRWNKPIKNPETTQAEIAAMAVRQAKRRVQEVRRRRLIHSTGEGGGSPQALVAITEPVMASTTIVDNQALRRFRSAARMLFLAYATKQHFDGHHDCAHELVLDTFLQMCKDLELSPVLVSEEECREIFRLNTPSGEAMDIGCFFEALDSISNA